MDRSGSDRVVIWSGVTIDNGTELTQTEADLTLRGTPRMSKWDHMMATAFGTGPDFLLRQDNARTHSAEYTMDVLRRLNILTMDWHAVSPHLNAFEHLAVQRRPIAPQILQQLKVVLLEELHYKPQRDIWKFSKSML